MASEAVMTFIRVLIILPLIIITSVAVDYNKHINKYEEVNFEIFKNRNKRSAFSKFYTNSSDKKVDLEIQFTSYGKQFHMLLSEDELFEEVPVKFDFSNTSIQKVRSRTKFYEGFLQDEFDSNIICFVSEDSLTGKITDSNYTYFIEPADIFFNNLPQNPNKIVVYRDVDIRRPNVFPRYPENFPRWKVLYRYPNVSANVTAENSGLDIFNLTENLFCEVELVADYTLYNFFRKNTERLTAVLYYHGKFADYIFRRSDFNMDGHPDDIRIVVGKISIYSSPEDENYPMIQASSITDYLTLFTSRRQSNRYCLSIGFFYKQLDGTAIGEAFKPEFRGTNSIGGICDPPIHDHFSTLSFNTGVINMRYNNGTSLPLAVTMLAFTHEIGHGFGSDHDPIYHPICSPRKVQNFLMYPFSSHGSVNAMKFSECSRKEIKNTLLLKGSCLKYENAKCGNGVREGDEECDCGEERFCNLIDSCCTPSDAKPQEKPCTIRSQQGFECSPKESECCETNCSIVSSKHTLCNSDVAKCLYSFCDGKSPKCPKLQEAPELCASKLRCNDTSCSNISVCESLGLKDCICTENLTIQCLRCCFKNSCVPVSELGIVSSDGRPFILQPGTSCADAFHECDYSGNCVSSIFRSSTTAELYILMTILSVFGITLILTAMYITFKKHTEMETAILTGGT